MFCRKPDGAVFFVENPYDRYGYFLIDNIAKCDTITMDIYNKEEYMIGQEEAL